MHHTLTVPGLFARLTHSLVALEQRCGRRIHLALTGCGEAQTETRVDAYSDLENLSMIHGGLSPERSRDGLDFLSLSLIDETPPGGRDGLGALSLSV